MKNTIIEDKQPEKEYLYPITDMVFVWIPAGSFMMGSPENEVDRCNNEKQHLVEIRQGFYLSKYLVTQAQWDAIENNSPHCQGNRLPKNVNWIDIQSFITRLNNKTGETYRLPTEAEWEYACRAETTTPFYTGNVMTDKEANFFIISSYNNNSKTTVVGSYPPNPWGLYDMAGNVWEWTASAYHADYQESQINNEVVCRGGSCFDNSVELRSAARKNFLLGNIGDNLGFRLVLSHVPRTLGS